jgi:hypothetical protein
MEEASNGSFPVSREKPTRATTENDDEDELDDDNEYDHEALNRCLGLPWEQTNPPTVSGTSCPQLRPPATGFPHYLPSGAHIPPPGSWFRTMSVPDPK